MKYILVILIGGFVYSHTSPSQHAQVWDYVEGQAGYYAWEGIEKLGAMMEKGLGGKP